jgi:hypothetical protein
VNELQESRSTKEKYIMGIGLIFENITSSLFEFDFAFRPLSNLIMRDTIWLGAALDSTSDAALARLESSGTVYPVVLLQSTGIKVEYNKQR